MILNQNSKVCRRPPAEKSNKQPEFGWYEARGSLTSTGDNYSPSLPSDVLPRIVVAPLLRSPPSPRAAIGKVSVKGGTGETHEATITLIVTLASGELLGKVPPELVLATPSVPARAQVLTVRVDERGV